MRIALVIERFQASGGVERVAWELALGLLRAGEQVTVFARERTEVAGIEGVTIAVPNAWQAARAWLFSRRTRRVLRRRRFDVIHSFSRTEHQNLYRAGGGSHADYMERNYSASGRLLRELSPRHRVLLYLERRVYEDPRQWIQCNSERVRDEILERYAVDPARLVVTYNGVDLERFAPGRYPAEREDRRREYGASERSVWLFLGSGFHRKGLDTALEAIAGAGDENAVLWVAGGDSTRRFAIRAHELGIGDRVRFLGPRSDPEQLYAAADALILPTRYDAFANVCLEAAASALPVVTSAQNGAAEILSEAGEVVVDAHDAAGFAAAIDRFSDRDERLRVGARAREIACAYGWDRHVDEQRALYRRITRS